MTERNPPVWMQSGTYSASDDRMVTGLLVDRNVDVSGNFVSLEGGVVPPADQLRVTGSGSNMNYTVTSGIVIVPMAGSTPPGAYICYNDGSFTGTLDIEATGNPRIDLITAKVTDQATGGLTSSWAFTVIKGNPSPSPTTPSYSGSQIPIAAVRVIPAAQNGGVNKVTTSQITDLRNFITGPGGIHTVYGNAANPAHTPGRMMYNANGKSLQLSDGTDWNVIYTFEQIRNYLASYRPTIASGSTRVDVTTKDVWDTTPPKYSGTGSIDAISRSGVQTPSGSIMVTIGGYGRVDDTGTAARMGVEVKNGATVVNAPSTARGVSFYQSAWGQSTATWMITGLPTDTNLTVTLSFLRTDSTSGHAYFQNYYLVVQPIV